MEHRNPDCLEMVKLVLCLQGQIEGNEAKCGSDEGHSRQREQCINILLERLCFFF